MSKLVDLTGKKFGRLVVTERDGLKNGGASWNVLCECGKTKTGIEGSSLKRGMTRSCGCLNREIFINHLHERRKEPGMAAAMQKYCQYRVVAKNMDREFDFTFEDYLEISKENCYYCKNEPSQIAQNQHYESNYICNGIDRVDSEMGYTKDNCVACCWNCNKMKKNVSPNIAQKMLEFLGYTIISPITR